MPWPLSAEGLFQVNGMIKGPLWRKSARRELVKDLSKLFILGREQYVFDPCFLSQGSGHCDLVEWVYSIGKDLILLSQYLFCIGLHPLFPNYLFCCLCLKMMNGILTHS